MRFVVECYENQQTFRDGPVIHTAENIEEWIDQPMKLVVILTVDVESSADAAEEAFDIGNNPSEPTDDDGKRWPHRTVRSMSSGDVVVVNTPDGQAAYTCLSIGWASVDPARLNKAPA